MKVYSVTMSEWSESLKDDAEFYRQVVAETEQEACEEAERLYPKAAVHYATEVDADVIPLFD